MEDCTGKNIELDLSEQGMDLANLIFRVAQDCDNSYAFKGSIDASGFRDEILFQIKIAKVQYDNPNLSEAEIQKIVDELTAEHERKKTEETAEKAAKIESLFLVLPDMPECMKLRMSFMICLTWRQTQIRSLILQITPENICLRIFLLRKEKVHLKKHRSTSNFMML